MKKTFPVEVVKPESQGPAARRLQRPGLTMAG